MDTYPNHAKTVLNELSLTVAMLEPKDVEGLGVLLNQMDALIAELDKAGKTRLAALTKEIKTVVERIVLEEYLDFKKERIRIEQGITLLQEAFAERGNDDSYNGRIEEYMSSGCAGEDGTPADLSLINLLREYTREQENRTVGFPEDREVLLDYVQESLQHIENIKINSRSLENDPGCTEVLHTIFMFFHKLKGGAFFLDLPQVYWFTHEVERFLDHMVKDDSPKETDVARLILDAAVLTEALFNHIQNALQGDSLVWVDGGHTAFIDQLRELQGRDTNAEIREKEGAHLPSVVTPQNGSTDEAPRKDIKKAVDLSQDKEIMEGFIQEALDHLESIEVNVLSLEQDPENEEVLNAIFRPFHTIKGGAGFLNLAEINQFAHEVETLLDEARQQEISVDETVTDLILDAVDLMTTMIGHVKNSLDTGVMEWADFGQTEFLIRLRKAQAAGVKKIIAQATEKQPRADGSDTGDILIEKGLVSKEELSGTLEKQTSSPKKLGEILIEEKKVTAREMAVVLRDQKKRRSTSGQKQDRAAAFVKVDTQKLDNMVDMVGELVITQAMLGQDIHSLAVLNKRLYSNLAQLGRTTSEIQRTAMSLRMVPIKQTFHKMIRLVRDLSKKSGKRVKLEMVGEDTEMDRIMVDEIYDPLVHMIRNSVDHGIESPEERLAAGKSETGTVTLKAYHKGGNIVIEVSEDGKGLDREKILERAVSQNLIVSGENMTDQEIYALIFRAGFSTAAQVTDVSGRGVGMDVVKRAVEKMRGKLEIQSEKGTGTTILMKLPLTLAIIDGIMVRAGGRDFIIPAASVLESIRPDKTSCTKVANQGEMVKIRNSLHPLVRLHSLFGFEPLQKDPWDAIVVVAESDGCRKCLLVDELVGKQEVVIKSLGQHLKEVRGMAGGAILADGRVGLILDLPGVFELSEQTEG